MHRDVIVRLLCDHAVDANWLLMYLRAVGWNHTTRAARGGFEVGNLSRDHYGKCGGTQGAAGVIT